VSGTYQALLVLHILPYEQAGPRSLNAGSAIGLWLLAAGVLALITTPYPRLLAASAAVAGLGYLFLVLGFRRGGQAHPLFYAGSLLALGGYTVWAFWLSRLLLTGRLLLFS
jgi:hypothetical protein